MKGLGLSRLFVMLSMLVACVILSSCDGKKSAIEDLRDLRLEIRENGDKFSERDWNKVGDELVRIGDELEEYELTSKEEELVASLMAEIGVYKLQYDPVGIIASVTDALSMFSNKFEKNNVNARMIDHFVNNGTDRVEDAFERQSNRVFWMVTAWIVGGVVILILVFFLLAYIRESGSGSRRRSSRPSRSSRTARNRRR